MSDEFTCEHCKRTFERENTKAEEIAESEARFGKIPPEDQAVVCHECWLQLMTLVASRN
jgi:hypothetical protein